MSGTAAGFECAHCAYTGDHYPHTLIEMTHTWLDETTLAESLTLKCRLCGTVWRELMLR